MSLTGRFKHWQRKRRLRKRGVTVAWTDPNNPKKDWKPPEYDGDDPATVVRNALYAGAAPESAYEALDVLLRALREGVGRSEK